MNFQKKIVVCYSTLALFFSSILGIGLYYYMHRTYNERMENSLALLLSKWYHNSIPYINPWNRLPQSYSLILK